MLPAAAHFVRFLSELGNHVTVLRQAPAAASHQLITG
jgi:hypothetical protein